MTTRELAGIAKRLSSTTRLPAKDRLLFCSPIGHTRRGIFLGRSGDPSRFYSWMFFQPLSVRSDDVFFNMGIRLGPWNVCDSSYFHQLAEAVKDKALHYLEPLSTPRAVAIAAKRINGYEGGVIHRSLAYSFAVGGDVPQAIRELDRYATLTASDDREWAQRHRAEVLGLKDLLLSDPDSARRQLESWEEATLRALGLEHFK